MRDSKLSWDAATLDRFLTAPTTVVPGTSMVVPVSKQSDRDNLIAYFKALKDGTFKDVPVAGFRPPPNTPAGAGGPPKGEADWKKDAPGRVHHVKASDLPPPFDTPSTVNFPRLVPKPETATLSVPKGFKVEVFADKLQGPREMHLAPNGDILLAETRGGRISVLRPSVDGARAATVETFAQGLVQPFGLALYPRKDPKWLYVAEANRVVRYAYAVGDLKARGEYEHVQLERTYYAFDPIRWSLTSFIAAFLVVTFMWLRPKSKLAWKSAIALTTIGALMLVTAIVLRCIIRERPPVSTLYETVLFVTASCVLVAIFIECVQKARFAIQTAVVLGMIGLFVAASNVAYA